MRLNVVIVNWCRPELTLDAVRSLAAQVADHDDRTVVVVDNGSPDDSADVLEAELEASGASAWSRLVRAPDNRGYAAGCNAGMSAVEAEHYLLLNSDARVLPGTLDGLLAAADAHPRAGLLGPRLEWPDGRPQVSSFRDRTPVSEMLTAAGTGPLDRLLRRWVVADGVPASPTSVQWLSFACVLLRHEVLAGVGPLDETYFMYFEDVDYCRRARRAGWTILHDPTVRAVHLRGGTSTVKSALAARSRVPRYYYAARSRYFAKHFGGILGVVAANTGWQMGRTIAWLRETVGSKEPHAAEREALDNWTNWHSPREGEPVEPSAEEQVGAENDW